MSERARDDAQFRLDFPRIDPLQRPLIETGPYGAVCLALAQSRSWPDGRLALTGEMQSGRSRLLRGWAAEMGAAVVTGEMLASADMDEISSLSVEALAVDDADRGGNGLGLLAAINLCRSRGAPILLAGRPDPARWHAAPGDLVSRLAATGVVQIGEPDDETLARRLEEACAIRRLNIPGTSIRYIAERLDRRWTAVGEAADAIEAIHTKSFSLSAARKVLGMLGRAPD
jgi:chromosomal replication initiation ATPase DnaA